MEKLLKILPIIIHKAVYGLAEKYFVTPEHVIIGLVGEALANRKLQNDLANL
ncbi:MAG: hypothetical protein JRC91_01560 [Deltaproteobacteria bacterium]|nr:hypothetical protein [Deltaproteobacteria bacterium]